MMSNQNKSNKQQFLVLMDFSEASYVALKYTISMAKILQAKINVLHVANPLTVVKSENPMVAQGAIELDAAKNKRKLNSIKEIIKADGLEARTHYALGNQISEMKKAVEDTSADLVIIGKKKTKLKGLLGKYLMNEFDGSVLIVGEDMEIQKNSNISLGYKKDTLLKTNPYLLSALTNYVDEPIKLLHVNNKINGHEHLKLNEAWKAVYKQGLEIQYANQKESKVALGLINYIGKNDISLLCLGKGKKKGFLQRWFSKEKSIAFEVIENIDIPVLLMGKTSPAIL